MNYLFVQALGRLMIVLLGTAGRKVNNQFYEQAHY